MNSSWQVFLANHHAVVEHDRIIHFGDLAKECRQVGNGTTVTDLSHYGLIRFSGEDAHTFLQNQLSCDVREVNPHKAQYGSYCTPKGRVLAVFLLWRHGNDFFMQLPVSLCDSILKRLALYVLRANVQLRNTGDDLIRIGIAGANATSLLREITGGVCDSGQSLQMTHYDNFSLLWLDRDRMELITSIEYAPVLWEYCSHHADPVGASCWEWLNIKSGIPVIFPETQDAFLPQMLNLDVIGGISFNKGCYPGQEIVARTQYLGKLKRRMFFAHITTTEVVRAGDALYSSDRDDQPSGSILNAAPSPEGGYDVLAVIQQECVTDTEIYWCSQPGPILEIRPLPYSLPV